MLLERASPIDPAQVKNYRTLQVDRVRYSVDYEMFSTLGEILFGRITFDGQLERMTFRSGAVDDVAARRLISSVAANVSTAHVAISRKFHGYSTSWATYYANYATEKSVSVLRTRHPRIPVTGSVFDVARYRLSVHTNKLAGNVAT